MLAHLLTYRQIKKIIVFRNFIIDEFAKYYKDLDFLIHLDGMGQKEFL